jgi:hypothetical protein
MLFKNLDLILSFCSFKIYVVSYLDKPKLQENTKTYQHMLREDYLKNSLAMVWTCTPKTHLLPIQPPVDWR